MSNLITNLHSLSNTSIISNVTTPVQSNTNALTQLSRTAIRNIVRNVSSYVYTIVTQLVVLQQGKFFSKLVTRV